MNTNKKMTVYKEKLYYQLFIGKVDEILGCDKTLKLLRESYDAINKLPDDGVNEIQSAIAIIEKYRKEMSENQAQRLYELLLKND